MRIKRYTICRLSSALKEDWRIALVGLGFSVFFTCLGAAILAKQKEKE